jgi:hypothetical protein
MSFREFSVTLGWRRRDLRREKDIGSGSLLDVARSCSLLDFWPHLPINNMVKDTIIAARRPYGRGKKTSTTPTVSESEIP